MSQARVRDAVATGATDFVTACPFCYQGLLVGITAEEAPIRMRDITEILTRALGVAGDETGDKEGASEEQGSGVRDQGSGTDG
jgi:heterodisulfide reductase subunit D